MLQVADLKSPTVFMPVSFDKIILKSTCVSIELHKANLVGVEVQYYHGYPSVPAQGTPQYPNLSPMSPVAKLPSAPM